MIQHKKKSPPLTSSSKSQYGFTIVELLIVIVVIGILAAITFVAFNGIQQRASAAVLRSDLKNAATQLEIAKQENSSEQYPSNDDELEASDETTFEYTSDGSSYCLSATSDRSSVLAYHISSDDMTITEGVCVGHSAPGGGQFSFSSVTWTNQTGAAERLVDVASSADGMSLIGAGVDEYLFTSSDAGATWAARTNAGSQFWSSVTSSEDGTTLAAAVSGGRIHTSSDSGATWTERMSSASLFWFDIASSSDGSTILTVGNSGDAYVSADSGASWTGTSVSGSVGQLSGATVSADGSMMAVVAPGGRIYTSSNSGSTWVERDYVGNWRFIVSSDDGTRLATIDPNAGAIYMSSDSGVTWSVAYSGTEYWYDIAMSSDGTKLVAVDANGDGSSVIYTSTDSGVTWSEQPGAGSSSWRAVTTSANGARIYATKISTLDGVSGLYN